MLNHASPVPLYRQLADIISENIQAGRWPEGHAIPSETRLAGKYGIGRPTVRQALGLLADKGIVEKRKGAGTFVRKKAREVDLFSLAGTSSAFDKKGIAVSKKILQKTRLNVTTPDPANPFSGKKAFFLARLTAAGQQPVLLEEMYLDDELFFGIDRIELENRSLSRIVQDQYHLAPVRGKQTFQLTALDTDRAAHLAVPPKTVVLEVNRTLDFPHAPGSFFAKLFCRTDRFVFFQEIAPGHTDKGER